LPYFLFSKCLNKLASAALPTSKAGCVTVAYAGTKNEAASILLKLTNLLKITKILIKNILITGL
jgi:hypothetical protein